jgi:hypothetical protein
VAINEVTLVFPARLKISWYDTDAPDEAVGAFEQRGFSVERCSDLQLGDSAYLEGLAAVVFTQSPSKLLAISEQLEAHAARLLDYGCYLTAVPAKDQRPSLVHLLQQLNLPCVSTPDKMLPLPHIRIVDETAQWREIGNFLLKNPAGPPPYGPLAIDLWADNGEPRSLDEASKILLQRGFQDCERVHLNPLGGGLSGAQVYVAYPTLRASYNPGRRPLPLFVKIDDRGNTVDEYKNYMERVDPHIPFHLGPHLIGDKCFLGSTKGILVGEYVEESESLLDSAKAGRASPAVACLFERTLYGWHRDARESDGPTAYPEFPDELPVGRGLRANELGALTSLKELKALLSKAVSEPMMVGPIHGDLNVHNIRVRGTDAIVIDFLAHRKDGDIVYDAATLEASLFVEGFASSKQLGTADALKDVQASLECIRPIYDVSFFSLMPPHPAPENPSKWFFECVRQIRKCSYRVEIQSGQYAAALARALLRKACKDRQFSEHEEYRRAAAFVLAESVLLRTFGRRPSSGASWES